jgi:Tfp pilus assembly protein PilZ
VDHRQQEKRKDERVFTTLPVDLKNTTGLTRDVSASGVFFETDARYRLGNAIQFAVEMDTPGGKMLLTCEGEIVRVEPRGARLGVAVKIIESAIEPARS